MAAVPNRLEEVLLLKAHAVLGRLRFSARSEPASPPRPGFDEAHRCYAVYSGALSAQLHKSMRRSP